MIHLTEIRSKELLRERGMPVPRGSEAHTASEARALAAELRTPLVCKLSRPGLLHKSELGGVVLGLDSAAALEHAARELLAKGGEGSSLLVEEQVAAAVEVIAGLKRLDQIAYIRYAIVYLQLSDLLSIRQEIDIDLKFGLLVWILVCGSICC